MNSTRDDFKILPTSFSTSISKSNRITRANTLLFKSFNIDQNKQNLNKFISNSQIGFSSKTTKHFHQQHHPHIKWVTYHQSFQRSLTDFKLISMADIPSNSSIKDFDNEHQDQTIKYISNPTLTSEDEGDRELLPNRKTFVDQASQAVLEDPKPKKKIKSSHSKKIKSNSKRANVVQIPLSTLSLSSPNRVTSNGDLTTLTNPMKVSSSIGKNEENNGTKSLITVDTSRARSNLEVVRLCLRELGWKECSYNTTPDSDIYWHSSSFHEGNTNFAFNSGRVNKFPGMNDLLRKVHLTRSLNNMRLLFPIDYNFYPKTWFLPEQNQQFKDDVRYIHHLDKKHNRLLTTFIVKPSDGSQGEGIYLLRDPSHIVTTNRPHVVQEYIDRPLLINGLKFDLRIYVLILNLHPLEIFLYDEGLVRFATINYKAPSIENLHQTYMHLTNYSLNKRSANYKHTIDEKQTDGSKRKLSLVWKELSQMFGNEKIERTKNLITELINKTIFAVVPELRVEYEFELPSGKKPNLSCFQIIGFDIILTDQLKPILLEVNANPSLRIDFDKNEAGKLIYESSLIDEEIKKPLILETLKLALPKKKLNTITRHAQNQVDDELMAQRFEKLAQRRVDERTEKLKSARKTRFDIRLNPFFSRPLESVAKEFVRQQQEQQQIEQQKLHHTFPTHPIILARSNELITPYTQFYNNPIESRQPIKKSKKIHYSMDDEDNESGLPTSSIITTATTTTVIETIKQPCIKSESTRPILTTDATMIRSINNLKLIFPPNHKTKYQHLFLIDQIADIYIQLVVTLGYKTMTGGQFRNFANICGIINETITASSIDILYYQMLKKWQQFVVRTTLTGLPFPAFLEAFFLLSQRKFPNAHSLLDSVNDLIDICVHHINPTLQTPKSPLISQSNPPRLHRTAKNNTNTRNSSSLTIHPNIPTVRSSTTTSIHRSGIIPPLKDHQIIPSTINIDDKTKDKLSRQATKSVFPLFFDVL